MRTRSPALLGWLLLGLNVVAGLSLLFVFGFVSPAVPDDRAVQPLLVDVAVTEDTLEVPASIRSVGAQDREVILLAQSSGVLTRLALQPGDVLTDGSVPISVNGVGRYVCSGPTPLYREVFEGTTGDDVATLWGCLLRGGHVYGSEFDPGQFSQAGSVVRELIGAPDRMTTDEPLFDPSWFLWSIESDWVVEAVHGELGRVPPPEGVLATGVKAAPPFVLDVGGDQILPAELPRIARYQFIARDGASVPLSVETLAGNMAKLPFGPGPDAATDAGDEGGSSQGLISVDGLLAVTQIDSEELHRVPATALVLDDDETCIFAGSHLPTRVEIVLEAAGEVLVSGQGALDEVIANPAQLALSRC